MSLALSVDIPFFPQLPKIGFQNQNITFDTDSFNNELPNYFSNFDSESFFKTSEKYSSIYSNFLLKKLEDMWNYLGQKGVNKEMIVRQSLLTPSSCCMVNNDNGKSVDNSFKLLKELSERVREKYRLY